MSSVSMDFSTSKLLMDYSMGLTKKAMDNQEQLAMNIINKMMPQTPAVPKGQYIDVYA